MSNPLLRWLLIRTGLVGAVAAAAVAALGQWGWAGVFAASVLLGLLNWSLLAAILLAATSGKRGRALFWLAIKIAYLGLLALFFLPAVGPYVTSFLCGFSLFLVVCTVEAIMRLWLGALSMNQPEDETPGGATQGAAKDG